MTTVQTLLHERIAYLYSEMSQREKINPKSLWQKVARRLNKDYFEYKQDRHTKAMLDELAKAVRGV